LYRGSCCHLLYYLGRVLGYGRRYFLIVENVAGNCLQLRPLVILEGRIPKLAASRRADSISPFCKHVRVLDQDLWDYVLLP